MQKAPARALSSASRRTLLPRQIDPAYNSPPMSAPYAHTDPAHPNDPSKWEPLFTPIGDGSDECQRESCKACESLTPHHGHLNKIAWWTAKFAGEMFPPGPDREAARQWGHLTGLWHDLGKFAPAFQSYLAVAGKESHRGEISGRIDHSTPGAQHANQNIPNFGCLLAYLIAGHHAGLPDGINDTRASLDFRLGKLPTDLGAAPPELLGAAIQLPPVCFPLTSGLSLAPFIRFLFSALVDADFLATEAFMNSGRFAARSTRHPTIEAIEACLFDHLAQMTAVAAATPVNARRAEILNHCLASASRPPGLFSLTVPTGGGKTLASLAFALRHARLHGLRRVIYVIPYTSIIEQNAKIFRQALASLGEDVVVEHHSNFDPDRETTTSRLATENWDARLIVTTNVQFFESLHANRTSRCRKLHRIARSVIILDEAQALPVELLQPCLRAIDELTQHYGASVVLCTATQPAITRNEEFKIGLAHPHEIIPDPPTLYASLRRVTTTQIPGKISDASLISRILAFPQSLCIVNTRRHARQLFELLPKTDSRVHLSALMCPQHRTEKLAEIKHRLDSGLAVQLVSTQLIEAGVDIDFPVVFRALAGLDSVAQAAGRCDREGTLTHAAGAPGGRLFIFEPDTAPPPGFIRSTAASTAEVLSAHPPDPLALESITDYFRTHYWKNQDCTDQKRILECWPQHLSRPEDLLLLRFRDCAGKFRLIDDYSEPILIPFGKTGRALCDEIQTTYDPTDIRILARKLQRYTVTIPPGQHARLLQCGILEPIHEDRFFVLNSDAHYSGEFGLHPDPDLTLPTRQSII